MCMVKPGSKTISIEDIWDLFGENWDIKNELPTLNLDDLEKSAIKQALKISNNVQTQASKLLGITARSLHYKLKKHNLGVNENEKNNIINDVTIVDL